MNALDKLMNARGAWSKKKESKNDLSNDAAATTPSYFRYGHDVIFSSNTGETELERRVLNHKVYCRGGEVKLEEFDGVRWRKNVHEGVLVRVGLVSLSVCIYGIDSSYCFHVFRRWKTKCTR